jgi:threonine synthase
MRYVSHLACPSCGATYPADRVMNLCDRDGRPVQMALDLDRLKAERGADGGWDPSRRDLWRFGGLLPLDVADPDDRRHSRDPGRGAHPGPALRAPAGRPARLPPGGQGRGEAARRLGRQPHLSFKDRGMALTVSMARALGLARLAVPTQGNAGDALARYAVAAGIEAAIVMSPDTDLPVLGGVAALARLHPGRVTLDLVPGTIVDCARRVREHYVPAGFFSVATFQEPGWRTEGKKTLGLEMAEPRGGPPGPTALATARRHRLPDRGGHGRRRDGQGVRRAGGAGPGRPGAAADGLRPVRGDRAAGPRLRGRRRGHRALPPGATIATGLNVAQNVGHAGVLRILRRTGGCAVAVTDDEIRRTIRAEWRARRFAWSPEGAATLAALPELADRALIRPGDRVVLVNTASPEKYLPTIRDLLDGGL